MIQDTYTDEYNNTTKPKTNFIKAYHIYDKDSIDSVFFVYLSFWVSVFLPEPHFVYFCLYQIRIQKFLTTHNDTYVGILIYTKNDTMILNYTQKGIHKIIYIQKMWWQSQTSVCYYVFAEFFMIFTSHMDTKV